MSDDDALRAAAEAALGRPTGADAGLPSWPSGEESWQRAQGLGAPAVPPPSQRAHWGYRVGANCADFGLAGAFALLVGTVVHLTGATVEDTELAAFFGLLAGWVIATSGFSMFTGGRSFGRLLAGSRVVREDGRRVGFWRSFVRDSLLRVLWLIPVVNLLDWFLPLGADRDSLRDRILNAHVVKEVPGRGGTLLVAAVLTLTVFGYMGALDDRIDTYTREDFLAHCEGGDSTASFCNCRYDEFASRITATELDDAEYQAVDEMPPKVQRAWDASFDVCLDS